MTFGPNPGIWADAVRKALNPNDERAARAHETGAEQALLDKEELRELELSRVYDQAPTVHEAPQLTRPSRLRSAIARIFGQSA
jgi:hypothetical protein